MTYLIIKAYDIGSTKYIIYRNAHLKAKFLSGRIKPKTCHAHKTFNRTKEILHAGS